MTPEQLAKSGTESAMQMALFCHCASPEVRAKWPALKWLYHVPNGGLRNPITAARMKAEGVKEGIPDIALDVAIAPYHGLRIEMKVGKNKCSPKQLECIDFLVSQSYYVVVCYSWQEAYLCIELYLGGTHE